MIVPVLFSGSCFASPGMLLYSSKVGKPDLEASEHGYILTTKHILAMLQCSSLPPRKNLYNSFLKGEKSMLYKASLFKVEEKNHPQQTWTHMFSFSYVFLSCPPSKELRTTCRIMGQGRKRGPFQGMLPACGRHSLKKPGSPPRSLRLPSSGKDGSFQRGAFKQ